jgi:hypothetical protein
VVCGSEIRVEEWGGWLLLPPISSPLASLTQIASATPPEETREERLGRGSAVLYFSEALAYEYSYVFKSFK